MKEGIFEKGLEKVPANFVPQTPLGFLDWATHVYPNKVAIIHGDIKYTYSQFRSRALRLASALNKRGIKKGDTVAIMAPNSPPMLEAHFGVPMTGAVLNALNFRLDPDTIAFILEHGEAKVLITDREFSSVIKQALSKVKAKLLIIDIDDPISQEGELLGLKTYEEFLGEGDEGFNWIMPEDEWDAICLNYTSGTTGNPKGVVYHHRGAHQNALGNALVTGLNNASVYLWTLPMFHCNGWCYPWAVTAVGATHICLRQMDPAQVFKLTRDHNVTHMCGAPIVLNMLVHAPENVKTTFTQTVQVFTGGAAPPSAIISAMGNLGFNVNHLYGLTEVYGPATFCALQEDWQKLNSEDHASKIARQGVRYHTLFGQDVINVDTMASVPPDGKTMGELVLRGNTVMKGYLKNKSATNDAFKGGWFHTGDLAVLHPDGYAEVKDRSKDVIISGGENISSLEVEETLYKHPDIMEAAVVAKSDEKWGEVPCAFITLKPDANNISEAEIISYCKNRLARYKAPKIIRFGPLPKTSTGKIQKYALREAAENL